MIFWRLVAIVEFCTIHHSSTCLTQHEFPRGKAVLQNEGLALADQSMRGLKKSYSVDRCVDLVGDATTSLVD